MLILISGVSGVGKNTVINRLVKERENLKIFLSGTTRQKREHEKDNETYIFMTEKEFLRGKENGEFLETEIVHGNYYGVLKKVILDAVENPDIDYIRDIDVKGNKKIKNYLYGKGKCLSIFLDAPDEVIKERLIGRGESEEGIALRMSRAKMEREHKEEYDIVIENYNLDKTVEIIHKVIDEMQAKD